MRRNPTELRVSSWMSVSCITWGGNTASDWRKVSAGYTANWPRQDSKINIDQAMTKRLSYIAISFVLFLSFRASALQKVLTFRQPFEVTEDVHIVRRDSLQHDAIQPALVAPPF